MIFIEIENKEHLVPPKELMQEWAQAVLSHEKCSGELHVRIVNNQNMQSFNRDYRKKDQPTNVLAFPFDATHHPHLESPIIGDIVLSSEYIVQEAQALQVDTTAHYAHMLVHGILHLLGYDHLVEDDAVKMKQQEVAILNSLGYKNPYRESQEQVSDE